MMPLWRVRESIPIACIIIRTRWKNIPHVSRTPNKPLQGEITEENLKAGILRRLMYNPNFAALKVSMRQFIDKL